MVAPEAGHEAALGKRRIPLCNFEFGAECVVEAGATEWVREWNVRLRIGCCNLVRL